MTISRASRTRIADRLNDLCRPYHDHVPLGDMAEVLADEGVVMEECILCGHDGRASLDLTVEGAVIPACLVVAWYRMESGRFEVTAYVS